MDSKPDLAKDVVSVWRKQDNTCRKAYVRKYPDVAVCSRDKCGKPWTAVGAALSFCAKCHESTYCSRDCQVAYVFVAGMSAAILILISPYSPETGRRIVVRVRLRQAESSLSACSRYIAYVSRVLRTFLVKYEPEVEGPVLYNFNSRKDNHT